ncbi:DUF5977 domain-containing protein [Persicitalea jodogahamensis]|uniref:DUF5977 domain-containing protein n=1 Tax=Persicitalea jodogahamensis TaxID=402147 RepID=A0A8J3D386_9BACT|nr:DUF5977 domain-containing protein [Persicitalea jodogahamensis]GHB64197.1 hypothetical protein GCM10007390_17600 [Persicitalea jodogahamensis]
MDYLATIQHQALALTRNPVVVAVDPVVLPGGQSRVDLAYFCELFVQKSFQSGQFDSISVSEASEEPPTASSTTSAGAYFELQTRLDDLLVARPPVLGSTSIEVCADMTRQYYTTITRKNAGTLLDTEQRTSSWAIKAGIAERDYDTYRDLFFTRHIGGGRRFLTWQPDNKLVRTDQPEWLYFLTNFSPAPARLLVRVRCLYADNTRDTYTALSLNNASYMTVYAVPVGMGALGLSTRPKTVIRYEVWLSNEFEEMISEVRSFRVWTEHFEEIRYLLYQNGLGGYDTVAFVGNPVESVKVSRQLVERFVGHDYLPTLSEEVINEVTGERQITLVTGDRMTAAHRTYFEDLLLSQEFYLADATDWLPLTPTFDSLTTDSIEEWPIGRSLTFRYANPVTRFSRLPKIAKETRPTGWRQWSTSCEIGANGLRSGRRIVNELVRYFLDDGTNVRPLITKANTPGTEGYISPWATADCDAITTPFRSLAISQSSTKKRSNCASGNVGTTWTIDVPANAFGSELSQADADAKAKAAATALDTQELADANGACILAAPVTLGLQNSTTPIGGQNSPVVALILNGDEVVPNTDTLGGGNIRYASNGLAAGTYSFDVRILYASSPFQQLRLTIASKGLESPVLAGNQTYRFANVIVNWGDAPIIIKAVQV